MYDLVGRQIHIADGFERATEPVRVMQKLLIQILDSIDSSLGAASHEFTVIA